MPPRFHLSPIALGLALCATVTATSAVAETLQWQSMIGIAQANNVVGTGSGAVTGGGLPWSAQQGHAIVELSNGHVNFEVRGLSFAGGNAVGTPGAVAQIKGTLVCDTDGSASANNSFIVDTPLIELDDQGNARFNGFVGPLPAVCGSEPDVAFLLRIGSGRWIANATVLR